MRPRFALVNARRAGGGRFYERVEKQLRDVMGRVSMNVVKPAEMVAMLAILSLADGR